MYVPFGKSVGDVTFRFSLRHHFWPRLKKTKEHNQIVRMVNYFVLMIGLVRYNTVVLETGRG